jgi:hypothetical protein
MTAAASPRTGFSPLAAWRDWRLARLDDRAFCRRVSLDGWQHVAEAADGGRRLLILVRGDGLPRTAERALRLFARAQPAETAGAVTYLPAGAAAPPPGDYQLLVASAEATASGALVLLRAAPSKK